MKFNALDIKNIRPLGWLKRQLEIQSSGLHGNLDVVWKDVAQSRWLGGDGDGWERFPYFLDGYIPLAYLTRDAEKINKVRKYVDCILKGQTESGFIKPINMSLDEAEQIDRWSTFLLLKVLVMYADYSDDNRIEGVVDNALKYLYQSVNKKTLKDWASARWFECYIPILWLYKRRPQEYLMLLAHKLRAHGIDYLYATKLWQQPRKEWSYETHVVNIAMALKYDAVYSELMGEPYRGGAEKLLEVLTEKHGTAYGHFNGDECLAGTSPVQGSELCGIVEAMYSYEWLVAVTGENKWADKLEALCFNGLPATITDDMWAHQYDQQVNQIACKSYDPFIFGSNGPEANMFGLEPHFGCCTANFGQGFPKFCASAVMGDNDGFVVVSPVPLQASRQIDGKTVTLTVDGEYPFRKQVTLTVDGDVKVKVHIPSGVAFDCDAPFAQNDGWICLLMQANTPVHITYHFEAHFEQRPNGAQCVRYGQLLFALPIAHKTERFEYVRNGVERKYPYCDYAFYPTENWQYAFAADSLVVEECDFENAFSRTNPPLKIKAVLAPVEWGFEQGYEDIACSVAGNVRTGANVEKRLVPYGSTYLRITEMKSIK